MRKNFGFQFDTSYLQLPKCFYTQLDPTPASTPEIIIFNDNLANNLGLDFSSLHAAEKAALFAGNDLLTEGSYLAQAYAGHQFGHYTTLGDGRAILWGEHITPEGKRWDIQFKGSGRTPYSRNADGRAALGPMIREYIISEAMHHLGIPTTRSMAVAATGEHIRRETLLPGAILTRVASSHLRVGTFEFAASQGDEHMLHALLNYTIERHYPHLDQADNQAIALLQGVMERQADLIIDWMRVGFIHGVMNTDNMTLSGETIDYGPCAFMDTYDPNTVFSSIDHTGRYAYQNQPNIAQWNLARLAETLLPLIHDDINKAIDIAEKTINLFPALYEEKWQTMMRKKLGLFGSKTDDIELINDLLEWMRSNHQDYTNTFLALSQADKPTGSAYASTSFNNWYQRWQSRLQQNAQPLEDAFTMMQSTNPLVIPRNHKVEQAIEAAYSGEFGQMHKLIEALKTPYQNHPGLDIYQSPPSPSERVYQTFCGT